MSAIFIATWLPYVILILMVTYGDHERSASSTLVAFMIAKICAILNPLIYPYTSRDFRSQVNLVHNLLVLLQDFYMLVI